MSEKDIEIEIDKGQAIIRTQQRMTERRKYRENGNSPNQYYPFNPFKYNS